MDSNDTFMWPSQSPIGCWLRRSDSFHIEQMRLNHWPEKQNFSLGREACILMVSSVMQRNSRDFFFWFECRTPNSQKTCLRSVLCEEGKSLSRCSTKGSLHTFNRIQHKASERQLKMCGLLLQPKVSLTAKNNLDCHLTPNSGHSEGWIGIILNASVMSALASKLHILPAERTKRSDMIAFIQFFFVNSIIKRSRFCQEGSVVFLKQSTPISLIKIYHQCQIKI